MTHDALNHDGEYRQLPVMLTNLWRPVLIDRPLSFFRPRGAHPLVRVICDCGALRDIEAPPGTLGRSASGSSCCGCGARHHDRDLCAAAHRGPQPRGKLATRYSVALVVLMVLAGVPVRTVATGPTRAAQVCTLEDKSHPRPLWFAKVTVSARGCPYSVTTPK